MIEFDSVTGYKFPLRIAYLDNDEQAVVHGVGDVTPGRSFRIVETQHMPHTVHGEFLGAND